jgi:CDP-glycerol glycerophosphotransferase (TagB/SpsB family)
VSAAERLLLAVVGLGDRVVPKADEVVVRTGPDFEDQGRELVAALVRAGHTRITWLVSDRTDPGPAGAVAARVVPARSPAGLLAYWRASVVVHTHGVYGSRRTSAAKVFVNMWHGMPVKRLPADSDVGRNQTDVTIATAPIHAENLAATWGLSPEQVAVTGLPRNDVLIATAARPMPVALRDLTGGRPLVVWLPTYRTIAGDHEVDGVDTGDVSQFAGGTAEAVNALMARLDVHAVLKAHPLAPRPEVTRLSHLDVWDEDDLAASGLTLYHLLAHADVLISDHSSVWIDFLLTQRPMVFAVSDLEEYAGSRGFYFDPVTDLFPGPLVTDLEALERELAVLVAAAPGRDAWADRRRDALAMHHVHVDAGSADRVARLVLDLGLGRHRPTPGTA